MGEENGNQGPSGTVPEGQGSDDYSLASGFLESIPENDRAIVQKYVEDWDKGVTQRFQQIHESYKPYKDLGEVDQLRDYKATIDWVNENPEVFFRQLAQELNIQLPDQQQPPAARPPVFPGSPDPTSFQGFPKEWQDRLEQNFQLTQQLAQAFVATQQQSQQQAEAQQLDDYLASLHKELGDFDEDSVLTKMARGIDGKQAAQDWIKSYGKPAEPQNPLTPFGGGGVIPGNTQRVADLNRDETVSLVAKMIQAGQQT